MKGSIAREGRRKLAEALAEERAKRTPQQQLARLDEMFGKGKGATKERAKLAKLTGKVQKEK
jgi:hypothetical protein